MKSLFNNNQRKCPTCLRIFEPTDSTPIVHVTLRSEDGEDSAQGQYCYCSDNCMRAKLDTLGVGLSVFEQVMVMSKNQVSKSPNTWNVVCQNRPLKIELSI